MSEEFIKVTDRQTDTQTELLPELLSELKRLSNDLLMGPMAFPDGNLVPWRASSHTDTGTPHDSEVINVSSSF